MDDLISRQAAIDAADRADYIGLAVEDVKAVTDEVVKELKKLPSAERRGRWIFNIDDKEWSWDKPYMCDQCDEWVEKVFKFCPNCGAKMDKEDEDE